MGWSLRIVKETRDYSDLLLFWRRLESSQSWNKEESTSLGSACSVLLVQDAEWARVVHCGLSRSCFLTTFIINQYSAEANARWWRAPRSEFPLILGEGVFLDLFQTTSIVSSERQQNASLLPQGHCKSCFRNRDLLEVCALSIRKNCYKMREELWQIIYASPM